MSKYEAVYFVGNNQAINRVRVDSSKTRNRGAFSGSLAALHRSVLKYRLSKGTYKYVVHTHTHTGVVKTRQLTDSG